MEKIHHSVANPVVSGCSCYAQKGTVIARQERETYLCGLLHWQREKVNTNADQSSLHVPLNRRGTAKLQQKAQA